MNGANGLQAILNRFLPRYQIHHVLNPPQQKACRQLQHCRTEALGGLEQQCHACGFHQPRYHSCRNRHCPQCQGRAQQQWSEQQQHAVLPVHYYHLVFTLPHMLNGWAELHPDSIYRILFQSAWDTLNAFGRDPKRLNGTLGMTAVLHTWGQNLSRHVHLHCLVPGGALTEDGKWNAAKQRYLFPVKALSRTFRGKTVSRLRQSAKSGELKRITRPGEIDATLNGLMQRDWVVYSKACLNRPETVIDYLARYSRKTALDNRRIQSVDAKQVQLHYKDYRDHNRRKVMTLTGEELIRRFLLHILPDGFMRIRHYGFLANRCRAQKLEHIRAILEKRQAASHSKGKIKIEDENREKREDKTGNRNGNASVTDDAAQPCPNCKTGQLIVIAEIPPKRIDYG